MRISYVKYDYTLANSILKVLQLLYLLVILKKSGKQTAHIYKVKQT